MNNCKEFILDDVLAVTAIPVGDLPAADVESPVNAITPIIRARDFFPTLTNAITIGLQAATAGGRLVPVKRHSGKAKDEESDNVAGRLHTVTVNCEVNSRAMDEDSSGSTPYDYLLALERTPSHLLLTFRDGVTRAFVASSQDTYKCTVEHDGSKTSVAFKIQNLYGIQLLV